MCKAFEDHYRSGVREGKRIGERRGETRGRILDRIEVYREQGIPEKEILERVMEKFALKKKEAERYFKMPDLCADGPDAVLR